MISNLLVKIWSYVIFESIKEKVKLDITSFSSKNEFSPEVEISWNTESSLLIMTSEIGTLSPEGKT